jgi:type VI protein secretion system component Hcp
MAQANIFLKICEDAKSDEHFVLGESYNSRHSNEIELTSWDWSVADAAVASPVPVSKSTDLSKRRGIGNSGANDKKKNNLESDSGPKPSQIKFAKTLDRSTTRLLSAMDSGRMFPKALLMIEDAYFKDTSSIDAYIDSPDPFRLTITLTEVHIVSASLDGTAEAAGVSFTESWTLDYKSLSFEYENIKDTVVRPANATEGTSERAPQTASEKSVVVEEQFDVLAKKKGLVKPAEMEEYFNVWAKKRGLIK